MTDLTKCKGKNSIQIAIETEAGNLLKCDPKFNVNKIDDSVGADQKIGLLECKDSGGATVSSFEIQKAGTSKDTIRLRNDPIGTYEIKISEEPSTAELILVTLASDAVIPFNYKSDADKYKTSPVIAKISFSETLQIEGRESVTSRLFYFDNVDALNDWLKKNPSATVEESYALKGGGGGKKVLLSFESREKRDAFLSNGEGFVLTFKSGGVESKPIVFNSIAELLAGLSALKDPSEVTLVHLRNGQKAVCLTADGTEGKNPKEKIGIYADYINDQETNPYSIEGVNVKEGSWFKKNGLDLRLNIPIAYYFKQLTDYQLKNPDIETGGIDEEYVQDYKASHEGDKSAKKYYEGPGIGVGATLYLYKGLGLGFNFDYLKMAANWSDSIDPTHGSDFKMLLIDAELRWSMSRTFDWQRFDIQPSGGIGYGYGSGDTTLQESFNPINTALDFGYGHIGIDVPITVWNINDNWKLKISPFFKALFPFSDSFGTTRYNSSAADFGDVFFMNGINLIASYQSGEKDITSVETSNPTYVKPQGAPVDLKSETTIALEQPKKIPQQPLIPEEMKLPEPKVEKLTILAKFIVGKTDLNEEDKSKAKDDLQKIKALIDKSPEDSRYVMRVSGHADSAGPAKDNEILSMGRANEYKNVLVSLALETGDNKLVDALKNAIIFVEGRGEYEPVDQDGKVIDIVGDGKKGPNDTWIFTNPDGSTITEDRFKSRRVEVTFEVYESGTEPPMAPEISEFQKGEDFKIASAIASKLNTKPFERTFYEESDNSINLVINDLSEKNLNNAKKLFLKTIATTQKQRNSALSSKCIIRFVIHGELEKEGFEKMRNLFYKFGEWPTAASPEFVSQPKALKIKAIVDQMKKDAKEKMATRRSLSSQVLGSRIAMTLSDGTTAFLYTINMTSAGKGLTDAEKAAISEVASSEPLSQITLYYNFKTAITDENAKSGYLKAIASMTGKKRKDITKIHMTNDSRLSGDYLFIISASKPILLSTKEDADAKIIRNEIFVRYGPKE